MNKLVEILDNVASIKERLDDEDFDINVSLEFIYDKLDNIEDVVLSTRDDGEFEGDDD